MTAATLHRVEVQPGLVVPDVVHWRDAAQGCSRCATVARHYVTPYYAPGKRLCTLCCRELNRVNDEHGWPQYGRVDIALT